MLEHKDMVRGAGFHPGGSGDAGISSCLFLTAVCHSVTSLEAQLPPGWKGAFICPRIQPSQFMSLCQIVHGCITSTRGFTVVLVTRLELADNSGAFLNSLAVTDLASDLQFGVQVAGWARLLCLQFKSWYNTPGSVSVCQLSGVKPHSW